MLSPQGAIATAGVPEAGARSKAIVQLARDASIEINVQDVADLESSRALLAAGTKVYVSHLPRQTWLATETACRAVRAAGFLPSRICRCALVSARPKPCWIASSRGWRRAGAGSPAGRR